jgi:hypothetical protein
MYIHTIGGGGKEDLSPGSLLFLGVVGWGKVEYEAHGDRLIEVRGRTFTCL